MALGRTCRRTSYASVNSKRAGACREDLIALAIAPRLPPPQFMALHVKPAPASAQPRSGPLKTLPPRFENCVKIKGWGLRLSFSKAHAVVAREKASTYAQSGTSHS